MELTECQGDAYSDPRDVRDEIGQPPQNFCPS